MIFTTRGFTCFTFGGVYRGYIYQAEIYDIYRGLKLRGVVVTVYTSYFWCNRPPICFQDNFFFCNTCIFESRWQLIQSCGILLPIFQYCLNNICAECSRQVNHGLCPSHGPPCRRLRKNPRGMIRHRVSYQQVRIQVGPAPLIEGQLILANIFLSKITVWGQKVGGRFLNGFLVGAYKESWFLQRWGHLKGTFRSIVGY